MLTLLPRRRIVRLAGLAVGLVVVLASPGVASAHASLVSSAPQATAVLPTSPTEVLLKFSERVNPLPDSIRVVAGDGHRVAVGPLKQDRGASTMRVTLPTLAKGTYIVAWKAISADSHPVSGAYTFSVGAATPTDPNLMQRVLNGSKAAVGDEVVVAVGRAFGYLGLALLLGGAGMAWFAAREELPSRRLGAIGWAGLTVAVGGTVVQISGQAAGTVGSWWRWGSVFDTDAGRWWFARIGVLLLTAPLLSWRDHATRRTWIGAAGVLFVAVAGVTAAGGHGATGHNIPLGFVATVLHLLAMACWLGGLVVVVTVPKARRLAAAAAVSPFALGSVVVLAVTGVVNAWRQSDSFDALRHSTYGRWLLPKLVVVAIVLLVAGVSRRLTKRSDGDDELRAARVRKSVGVEVVGVFVVLALTGGLTGSPPAHAGSARAVVTVDVVQGGRIAQITLEPAVSGGTTMHVYISSASGAIEAPTEMSATALLESLSIGPIHLPLHVAGPGHLTGSGVNLPFPGLWTITVVARYGDFDATTFSTRILVG